MNTKALSSSLVHYFPKVSIINSNLRAQYYLDNINSNYLERHLSCLSCKYCSTRTKLIIFIRTRLPQLNCGLLIGSKLVKFPDHYVSFFKYTCNGYNTKPSFSNSKDHQIDNCLNSLKKANQTALCVKTIYFPLKSECP